MNPVTRGQGAVVVRAQRARLVLPVHASSGTVGRYHGGMSGLPRILAIMGSGETTPTMARAHRSLLARVGGPSARAVILDTPYGFQENADDITARAIDYFRESVGTPFAVASFRAATAGLLERETALARIREAAYVFTGPGSPTYALRQWAGTEIPGLLAGKLADGGIVVAASAAALTIGRLTVPVYEIYKAGEEPRWMPGLDLLSALDLPVAVIPHFDNAEGGTHDTRFCYLGETRLRRLEAEMPAGTFVLGVDGHTALVLDAAAGTATVLGLGGVTVRRGGRSVVFPSGSAVAIEDLRAAARGRMGADGAPGAAADRALGTAGGATTGRDGAPGAAADRDSRPATLPAPSAMRRPDVHPLRAAVAERETAFHAAIDAGDVPAAVREVLALDATIVDWSRDTEQSDELDRARSTFRSMVVRLGEVALVGARDPAEAVRPFVDALIDLRGRARSANDWPLSDEIRDRLLAAGIEVHDAPGGSSWELRRSP